MFANNNHAFRTGQLLGHLQATGIDVRPVLDDDSEYSDTLDIFVNGSKIEIVVQPYE